MSDPLTATTALVTKKYFVALLFASGVMGSLVTWLSVGRPHTFWGWAVPNAVTNGIFGTTLVLLIRWWKPELPIELLFFVSASAGSLGKHFVVSLFSRFLGLQEKK